jgi:hypothetical protein
MRRASLLLLPLLLAAGTGCSVLKPKDCDCPKFSAAPAAGEDAFARTGERPVRTPSPDPTQG